MKGGTSEGRKREKERELIPFANHTNRHLRQFIESEVDLFEEKEPIEIGPSGTEIEKGQKCAKDSILAFEPS